MSLGFGRACLIRAVDLAGPGLRHVVIDLLPVSGIDATGILTIDDVLTELEARKIGFNAAGRATEWQLWAERRGFESHRLRFFPTLRQAIKALSGEDQNELKDG